MTERIPSPVRLIAAIVVLGAFMQLPISPDWLRWLLGIGLALAIIAIANPFNERR